MHSLVKVDQSLLLIINDLDLPLRAFELSSLAHDCFLVLLNLHIFLPQFSLPVLELQLETLHVKDEVLVLSLEVGLDIFDLRKLLVHILQVL